MAKNTRKMMGIDIPPQIQEMMNKDPDIREGFLAVFSHITERDLKWNTNNNDIEEDLEVESAKLEEKIERQKYEEAVQKYLKRDEEEFDNNLNDIMMDSVLSVQTRALEASSKLNQLVRDVRQEDCNTTLYSPRQTTRKTRYEQAASKDLRKLAVLIGDESDSNDGDEDTKAELFSKEVRQLYSPDKIVSAWTEISMADSEFLPVGEKSLSEDLVKKMKDYCSVEEANLYDKSQQYQKVTQSMAAIKGESTKLLIDLSNKFNALEEVHGRDKIDLIRQIVRNTRSSECFAFLSAKCLAALQNEGEKVSDEVPIDLTSHRLTREKTIVDSANIGDDERVDALLSKIEETKLRCEREKDVLTQTEKAEMIQKEQVISGLNASMIDAYEVNTYRTLKETICDDPSLSLESVIDSLFATNEYATYPDLDSADDEWLKSLEQSVSDRAAKLEILYEACEKAHTESKGRFEAVQQKLRVAVRGVKDVQPLQRVLDDILVNFTDMLPPAGLPDPGSVDPCPHGGVLILAPFHLHHSFCTFLCHSNTNTKMDPIEFGSEEVATAGHPIICAVHVGFRTAALFIYLFGAIFSASFVTCFVVILLCLAADFWVVKNVTGRFLVGLRWRNNVNAQTGQSNWVYESRSEAGFKRKPVLAKEFRVFWGGLIICPVFWALLSLSCLFTLKFGWLVVCVTGFGFNGANLYGYIRCKMGGVDAIKSYANNFLGKQVLSRFMASAGGASTTAAAQSA